MKNLLIIITPLIGLLYFFFAIGNKTWNPMLFSHASCYFFGCFSFVIIFFVWMFNYLEHGHKRR